MLAPRGESSLNVPVETQSPVPAVCHRTYTPGSGGMRQMLPDADTPSPASLGGNAAAKWQGREFVSGFSALAYRARNASRGFSRLRSEGYRGLEDEP